MSTCCTCAHWQWPYEDDEAKHLCCHPKIGSCVTESKDGADIENRGDATGIVTGAQFGCVHHESTLAV